MKKSFKATLLVLSLILVMSFTVTGCFHFWFFQRSYSMTNCLTESITDDMDIYDIAKHYRDGGATVAVKVEAYNNSTKSDFESLGSGVCVASKGYTTSIDGYQANKGSYIVTNYHVIDYFDSNEFSKQTVNIITEDEYAYEGKLLWYNKNLDVAIVYCDGVNLNYVTMKDRIVDCTKTDKLDYEPIFTIGTPLELDYINRLTVGNVASNNPMMFYTTQTIYPYTGNGGTLLYTNYPSVYNSHNSKKVLSNLYEDVVDIALGISPGNSGGGCFDKNGYLVGLSTLGGDVEETNGNQMNGMVAIYPIMKVLDKIINEKENHTNDKIFTINSLGIKGLDRNEASYASYLKKETLYSNYFLEDTIYSANYYNAFTFKGDGYYIISSSNKLSLPTGAVITACSLNNGQSQEIIDRNDLIYLLLKANEGDKLTVKYTYETDEDNVLDIVL